MADTCGKQASTRAEVANRLRRVGTSLALRLATSLPSPLRPSAAKLYHEAARRLASWNCRRKYGAPFMSAIHADDDLMHYALSWATGSSWRYYTASRMYFDGGAWNASEVAEVLRSVGVSFEKARAVLEFACGYGRLTRHFVHMVEAPRITVADIDEGAVNFLRERLGVGGFYSTSTAGRLVHQTKYDLIIVVSLFSHLPSNHWGQWLRRLATMLADNGVLVFSTLGPHAFHLNVGDAERDAFSTGSRGFLFKEENETRGRLEGAQYGAAYVDETYVRNEVDALGGDWALKWFPQALNKFQDLYVVRRDRG